MRSRKSAVWALVTALHLLPGSAHAEPIDIAQPVPRLAASVPARLVDTRPSGATVDGREAGVGVVRAAVGRRFAVAGRAGVRDDASAVVLNVTAVGAASAGSVYLWRCGSASTTQTVVHFTRRDPVANTAIIRLGASPLCVGSTADVHVVIDLVSQFTQQAGFEPGGRRLMDTRTGNGTTLGPVQAGRWKAAADSLSDGLHFLNVTVRRAGTAGFVTVQACVDGGAPLTSSVNYRAGETISNLVAVAGGQAVCVYSSATAHVTIDLVGWTAPAQWPAPAGHDVYPGRHVDTRWAGGQPLAAGGTLRLSGFLFVPGTADILLANITAVGAAGAGHLTAYACDQPRPTTSTLNVAGGAARAHLTFAPLSAAGELCIHSTVATHVVLDVAGWYDVEGPLTVSADLSCVSVRAPAAQGVELRLGSAGGLRLEVSGGVTPLDVVVTVPPGWTAEVTPPREQVGAAVNALVVLRQDTPALGEWQASLTVADASGATVTMPLELRVTLRGPIPVTC